jgi:hypothetical protein
MSIKLSNEVKVSLVTAVCILALTAISKNIIHAQIDFISQFAPVWMFVTYIITREKAKVSKICDSPLFWSTAIVLVTLAILIVYAI